MSMSCRSSAVVSFFNFNLAEVSSMCGVTDAGESVDTVHTFSLVLARVGGAFINVHIAIFTFKTRGAFALVAVEAVETLTTVHARIAGAIVDVCLASEAGVAARALAHEI